MYFRSLLTSYVTDAITARSATDAVAAAAGDDYTTADVTVNVTTNY